MRGRRRARARRRRLRRRAAARTPSSTSARPGSRTCSRRLGAGPGDARRAAICATRSSTSRRCSRCYKLRAVPINVNYRYVDDELAYLLADADVVGVVHDAGRASAPGASRRVPGVAFVLDVDDARLRRRTLGAASTARDLGPRSRRRPLRAVHRRHDRHAEGRGVAPRGHLLRRDWAAGTRAVRRSRDPTTSRRRSIDNPAQRLRPFLPAGDAGPRAVRLARARSAHARERAVVGDRHAARRRQGRAVRPAARRHGARARSRRARSR